MVGSGGKILPIVAGVLQAADVFGECLFRQPRECHPRDPPAGRAWLAPCAARLSSVRSARLLLQRSRLQTLRKTSCVLRFFIDPCTANQRRASNGSPEPRTPARIRRSLAVQPSIDASGVRCPGLKASAPAPTGPHNDWIPGNRQSLARIVRGGLLVWQDRHLACLLRTQAGSPCYGFHE